MAGKVINGSLMTPEAAAFVETTARQDAAARGYGGLKASGLNRRTKVLDARRMKSG